MSTRLENSERRRIQSIVGALILVHGLDVLAIVVVYELS